MEFIGHRNGGELDNLSLRILLTVQTLEGRPGGSVYVKDLAQSLLRLGQKPVVYSPRLGDLADELRSLTIPVIGHLEQLSATPDIVHGNSPIETIAALLYFQQAPAIFVCHGWEGPDAKPPLMDRIRIYIAVDETCRDRLVCQEGIPEKLVRVHYNPVDLHRFRLRGPLPQKPKRALVFSNYAQEENYIPMLREVCAEMEMTLDVMGAGTNQATVYPERSLGFYDLVFAKARCALEALAVGCAVILCDTTGMGELVTLSRLKVLRSQNFGRRALNQTITMPNLLTQIERYDAQDADQVTERIRREEGLEQSTMRMVSICREAIADQQPSNLREDMRAAALFLESIAPQSNTFAVAAKIRMAEAGIRDSFQNTLREALAMEPLPEHLRCAVRMRQALAPERVAMAEHFSVTVYLTNETGVLLTSYEPSPLVFSFRWLDASTGNVVVQEGNRSKIFPPLPNSREHRYPVAVLAPASAGHYLLRLTLVQEGVAWFDHPGIGCWIDKPVEVI